MDEMLTTTQAAAELGVRPVTIRYRLEKGLMRGVNYGGRMWLIPHEEVERWRKLPSPRWKMPENGGTVAE